MKYTYNNYTDKTTEEIIEKFDRITIDIDDSNDNGYDVNISGWDVNDLFYEIAGTCYIEEYEVAVALAKKLAKRYKAKLSL